MKTYLLDCSQICCKADFWEIFLKVVQPEGAANFGRNLDAFWDAVSGGGPGWPGECQLTLINTEKLELQEPRFFGGLQQIALDLPEYASVTIVFASP